MCAIDHIIQMGLGGSIAAHQQVEMDKRAKESGDGFDPEFLGQCEVDSTCQKFLLQNFDQGQLQQDLFRRTRTGWR